MNSADKAMAVMRRQVRAADEIALVNKRAYSMFRAMSVRAIEDGKAEQIDFTVEDIRKAAREAIHFPCRWCERIITAKNFSLDHKTPICRGGSYQGFNLRIICSVCNGQKGSLIEDEFRALRAFLVTITVEAKADVLRRLGLGARWRS